MQEIVFSDARADLEREVQQLRGVLASLTSERDELRNHICPELTARYFREIGDYENRLNYQKIIILETKRRIEIARAALNREKIVSEQEVDEKVAGEYREYREKADEAFRRAEKARKENEERERRQAEFERAWEETYGGADADDSEADGDYADGNRENGHGGGDGGQGTDRYGENENGSADGGYREDTGGRDTNGYGQSDGGSANGADAGGTHSSRRREKPDAKSLYRKIIKKLHPDVNPNITEHEKELFYKAVRAYQEGDVVTLQEIYDEIFSAQEVPEKELSMEELAALRDKLKKKIRSIQAEIEVIRKTFPYTIKDYLDDTAAVQKKRQELEALISQNEKTLARLGRMYQEICEEMNELREKRARKGNT